MGREFQSILDLFLLSENLCSYPHECVIDDEISDHKMVLLSIDLGQSENDMLQRITVRDYERADNVTIIDYFRNVPGFLSPALDGVWFTS